MKKKRTRSRLCPRKKVCRGDCYGEMPCDFAVAFDKLASRLERKEASIHALKTELAKTKTSEENNEPRDMDKGDGSKEKVYETPNILEALRTDVLSGKRTISEAAEELHQAGWMNHVDEEKAIRLLKL